MNRLPLLLLPLLAGCVGYPRVYWRTLKGQASVEDGKPVGIKAAILKECETLQRETQTTVKERATQTDEVGSSRVDLQACKLEYSIVSPK